MLKLRWAVAIAAVAGLFLLPPALADIVVKDGGGTSRTVFGFVCFTTKLCNAEVLINSAGTEIGTTSNPVTVNFPSAQSVSAAQSGTWTVQPGNTANTTAWLVTGTGGTFPATQSGTWNVTNISGTVSLPTGAATAANQTTIDGRFTAVTGTKNAGTAAASSWLVGAVYNSTPLTLTNTQQASLQADANGYLKVNVAAGGAGGGAVYGPTAVGSPAANPPVLIAGTANATATGNVQVAKVDSAGTQFIDCVSGGTLCTALATGVGTPGSAPPANVLYMGVNGSGATGGQMKGVTGCDATAIYDASTSGSTELVALTSGRSVYICGYTIVAGGTVNVKLITGTGTACATGSANLTPAFQLTAQVGAVDGSQFWRGLKGASASAVCINTSAGIAVQAIIYYSVI